MTTPHLDALRTLRAALAPQYEVDRPVGAGGMGSVYLGRDTTLDRPVAIKVISPELSASAPFRERFLHEARTIARLRHPNIVAVFAAGERDGLLWYVMEYVPGESLRDLLERERRLTPERTRAILGDIAAALAYAHAHEIVHRDLKPENILLDAETGRAMLADFGVAKSAAAGEGSRTGTGIVLGSPRYMSPEQAAGERALDGRSDLYTLGLVGYEMLAGEPVFGKASGATLMAKQITERPEPIQRKVPGLPAALAEVIDRALEKSPEARWPDAAAMRAALDAGSASGASSAAGRAVSAAFRRPRERRILAAVAGLLLLAIPALWFAFGRDGGVPSGVDPRKSFFVAPFEVLGGDARLQWLSDGAVSMLTSDLALWSDLDVVDYERTLDMLRAAKLDDERVGLDAARRLAREAGVWTTVLGQVTATGDSLTVIARVYDVASGRRVREAQRSAPVAADPRALFDRVARDLLDLAGAPAMDPDVSRRTTTSLDAYRAYLEGVRALNAWRLDDAEAALGRATRADSTFALAYYKKALAIGWRRATDSAQLVAVEGARRHGARLPQHERDLIEAYSAIVNGLVAGGRDPVAARAYLADAQRRYENLVRQDSTDAEAWYGLGDSYFHGGADDAAGVARNFTRALRAFDRTTRLDSTFHLAYAHKVNIFQAGSTQNTGLVVEGDSVIGLGDRAAFDAFGRERRERAMQDARRRALTEARHWVDADPDAPQPRLYLANSYAAAGFPDSAAFVIRQGVGRPGGMLPDYPFQLAVWEAMIGDTASRARVRAAAASTTPDSLRSRGSTGRVSTVGAAAGVAALYGDLETLDRIVALLSASEVNPPQFRGAVSLTEVFAALGHGLRAASGGDLERARRGIDATLARLDRVAEPVGSGLRGQAVQIPYVAYLAWRDPKYLAAAQRYNRNVGDTLPELRALEALRRGDSALARRLAAQMVPADTSGLISFAGMRKIARAEVLAELGDERQALAQYESIAPRRFNNGSIFEPGWPLYARSFPARARIYEQLGERDKAIAAYETFLSLWSSAHPALQPQVRAAREALTRLRDAPATAPAR